MPPGLLPPPEIAVAYCTKADLIDRYGEQLLIDLTDRGAVATGAIDDDVVDRAIAEADALIDGYCAGRYVLPFATVPVQIGPLSRQIAIYTLHVYEPNEKITADYKEAIRQLQQIASGTLKLNAEGAASTTTDAGGARVTDRERPMTEQSLKGWI